MHLRFLQIILPQHVNDLIENGDKIIVNSVYEKLSKKKVLVTGATGLIGRGIVLRLLDMNCKVIVVTRNREKAFNLFGNQVEIIETDIKCLEPINLDVSYFIHAAAPTSSNEFIDNPVSVIIDNVLGTQKMLELAKHNPTKGFVYLSTMEIYGHPDSDEKITEQHGTNIDTMVARSSYPESKRACECLCAAYCKQYNLPAKVIRLTQTFGKGVSYSDKRVFAEFAKCVIESKNIVLHTDGSTKRSYLYLEDAVEAILTVLVKGMSGQAYNAANESTYCSIMEMAQLVAKECGGESISVVVDIDEESEKRNGYAPKLQMNLSTDKLRSLGWKPRIGLKEMFDVLITDLNNRCD